MKDMGKGRAWQIAEKFKACHSGEPKATKNPGICLILQNIGMFRGFILS